MNIKIITLKVGEDAAIGTIDNSLKAMQKFVGGHIEVVYLDPRIAGAGVLIVCNEEGKIKDLPVNRGYNYDILVGDCFICGTKGDDFASLTDGQINRILSSDAEFLEPLTERKEASV